MKFFGWLNMKYLFGCRIVFVGSGVVLVVWLVGLLFIMVYLDRLMVVLLVFVILI